TVRIAVLGGLVMAIVLVVLLRLAYLQILSGGHYRSLANSNQIREIRIQPPRGEILDRNGNVLVGNRTVLALEVRPSALPASSAKRGRELAALGELTHMSPRLIERRIRSSPQFTGYPAVIREGVGRGLFFYLLEHRNRFPGVSVEHTYVRSYRDGSLAAHVLGIVGQVSPAQLKRRQYQGLTPGDLIGQSGIEYAYDRFLRGTPGERRIQVDALGRPQGQLLSIQPKPGDNLRLTLDAGMQATGDAALRSEGRPGAFGAMD